eukprot:TRINITY_DN3482_c0_g1_i3.p3 TRINITY_DN3482_c0_g1~~TRINITY_DN3482_c0_g1_i3.p3  ORF type:complete len:140 (-),score=30.86 TRINITY_DN3482_c0_g1_i3:526-945(-)
MTCLFLSTEQLKPLLRLRLVRPGSAPLGLESVVAKAEIRLPAADSGMHRIAVPLLERPVFPWSRSRATLGVLDVGVEVQAVTKCKLREYLRALDAKAQPEAFLIGTTPITEGRVEEDEDETERSTPVARGEPLSRHVFL